MTTVHEPGVEPADGAEELFVEFANTIELTKGVAEDLVPDGRSMRRWLVARSLLRPSVSASEVKAEMGAFRDLRNLVRDTISELADGRRPGRVRLRRLNEVLREGKHHHELRVDPTTRGYRFAPVGEEPSEARSAIASSLAHFLAEHDPSRLRVCANEGCRWVFVDRSPAGRRRWCDMRTCGNRAKVARHRARRRGTAQRAASGRARGATGEPRVRPRSGARPS